MIRRAAVLALGVLFAAAPLPAQQAAVPVELQFSLFFRILTYDRSLPDRGANGVVIGVAYQGRLRASALVAEEALRQAPPPGFPFPVQYVAIDLDTTTDLAGALARAGCDVLYVAPLRAYRVADIAAAGQARRILTLTGVPDYVEAGLGVGIGLRGDRPEILVNLAAARAEGADFSATFLQLATVR